MRTDWDVIVVGAGPAGMASASAAAEQGFEVLLLDEQLSPGGQIYKNIERQPTYIVDVLGDDYRNGFALVDRFHRSEVTYLPQSTVWKLGHTGQVYFSRKGNSMELKAKRVILATGAMERPQPFTGWTLPGVLGAGAADALFKGDGVIPSGPITMVGSGPIMLLVAGHMKKLGVEIEHFFDTTPSKAILCGLPHLPMALKRPGYLLKGVGMFVDTLLSAGKYTRNVKKFKVSGRDCVEKITALKGSKEISVSAKTVLVHEGIIPRTEFSRQLRLAHSWSTPQRYWHPTVDAHGRTSSPAIFMTGDGTAIHGAIASEIKGEITGLTVAEDLGCTSQTVKQRKKALAQKLVYELYPRPFIDAIYPPPSNTEELDDEVMVCRCEEVKAVDIRRLVSTGQTTPEMVKSISRIGMGPCQGRMCSCSLSEIIASETDQDLTDVGTLNIRPPVRNIGLGELAKMKFRPTSTMDNEGAK